MSVKSYVKYRRKPQFNTETAAQVAAMTKIVDNVFLLSPHCVNRFALTNLVRHTAVLYTGIGRY
jgi:hypothetical protein